MPFKPHSKETLTQRIDFDVERLRAQTPVPHPAQPVAADDFNGQYSISPFHNEAKNQRGFMVRVAPSIAGVDGKSKVIAITVPPEDKDQMASYAVALERCMENEYAMVPFNQPLNELYTMRLVQGTLARASAKYPEEFSNIKGADEKGLFLTTQMLPRDSEKIHSISIQIRLRSQEDYNRRNTHYILKPVKAYINTHIPYNPKGEIQEKTHAIAEAKRIQDKVDALLKERGFHRFDLRNAEQTITAQKEIPKKWIDSKHIPVKRTRTGMYKLWLVSKGERYPQIPWSTGTRDETTANRIQTLVQKEFLPSYLMEGGAHQDEPITLHALARFIRAPHRFPNADRVEPAVARDDIRIVTAHKRDIVRLMTPGLDEHKSGYNCTLRFASLTSTEHCRELDHPLNTSSRKHAEAVATRLQTATQMLIQRYFEDRPRESIVTETQLRTGEEPATILRLPEPNELPPKNRIFMRDVIDTIIQPALKNFNRDIYWSTKVSSAANGRYAIRCQLRRNDTNEELAKDTCQYQGPFTLYAPNELQANAFAEQLEHALLEEQYLFGRDRQVDSFAQPSIALVTKDSLAAALRAFPDVATPNTPEFQRFKGRSRG